MSNTITAATEAAIRNKVLTEVSDALVSLAPDSPRWLAFRDALQEGASLETATKLAAKLPLYSTGSHTTTAPPRTRTIASREAELTAAAATVNAARGYRKVN